MLDKRLEMIYELLPNGVLCDVGTDHCKLAAAAVIRKKATKAYATDLREGPLSAAKRLIQKEGLQDKITTILSDGFLDIPEDIFKSVDCFVIAGMGGELIANIIKGRHTDKFMVLQPMTAINELVEFLLGSGYNIIKRTLCRDGDKIYNALLVKYDGKKRDVDLYGITDKDALFYEYMKKEKKRVETALYGIEHSEKSDKTRIPPLEKLLAIIEKELENESK